MMSRRGEVRGHVSRTCSGESPRSPLSEHGQTVLSPAEGRKLRQVR